VDPRLVSLFQRSYPKAEIGVYDDAKLEGRPVRIFQWAREKGDPDFYAPMGTPLYILRKTLADFPKQTFLKADPQRTAEFRARLETFGPGPYVGIGWRSMVMGAKRGKYFSPIDSWGPVLTTPGVTFVNLQYGTSRRAGRRRINSASHPQFRRPQSEDDLEGAAALSSACDLVISPPPLWRRWRARWGARLVRAVGRVWPQLACSIPGIAARGVSPAKFADWANLMPGSRGAGKEISAL
jgi:hypothetical protein